jgi:hypothetical protein
VVGQNRPDREPQSYLKDMDVLIRPGKRGLTSLVKDGWLATSGPQECIVGKSITELLQPYTLAMLVH